MSRRGLQLFIGAKVKAVGQAATVYSDAQPFHKCVGTAAIHLISTAGSVTITQQVSYDGTNFFDPVDAAGSAVGSVGAAITVTTGKWISYSPVFAPYIRYKIVEQNSAPTVVTLRSIYQEEL